MSTVDLVEARERYDTTESHRLHGPWLMAVRVLSVALIVLTVVVLAVAIPVRIGGLSEVTLDDVISETWIGISPTVYETYFLVLDIISFLTFLTVALILFLRRSDNWMAMLVAVMLVTFGGVSANTTIQLLAVEHLVWDWVIRFLSAVGTGTFVFFLYTFPGGRFEPRWLAGIAAAGIIWFVFYSLVPLNVLSDLGVPGWLTAIVSFAIYGGSAVLGNYRLNRYASRAQMQQVKWVIGGLCVALVGFIVVVFPPLIFPTLTEPGPPALLFGISAQLILIITLTAVPVTIAISMLRYRLWDVDFYINRGMVYGGVTVAVLAIFGVALVVMQQISRIFTGEKASPVVLIIAAAVAGASFQTLRRRLQRFVDRRFYGIEVDYQKTAPPPPTSITGELTGRTLGAYTVLEPIGRGGMAEIYMGRHPTLNRTVAIKILSADRASETDFQTRFEREAQTVATLRHPHIVQVFDFGVFEGIYYMVMEYIDGVDLKEYIRRNGAMPLGQAKVLISSVASALDYAHELGLVHRDIKPSNVMLQRDTTAEGEDGYRAVLMDFGIAKIRGTGTALTKTGMVGTLDYIAPEQIRDAKDVDGRADVYALGVMAYEMLTGKLPFMGSNPGAILIAHMQQPPPDPRMLRSELPEEVAGAVMRAMAKEPAARFTMAGEFVVAMG